MTDIDYYIFIILFLWLQTYSLILAYQIIKLKKQKR